MKLATFTHQGSTRIGVVIDDAVVDLAAAAPELPREMAALLAAGAGAMDRARAAATAGKNRIARMVDSPCHPESEVLFTLSERGVSDPATSVK